MTTHNSQHSAEALEAFTPQPLDIAMNTEATETPASWATSAIVTLFLPRTVTALPDFAGETKTAPCCDEQQGSR